MSSLGKNPPDRPGELESSGNRRQLELTLSPVPKRDRASFAAPPGFLQTLDPRLGQHSPGQRLSWGCRLQARSIRTVVESQVAISITKAVPGNKSIRLMGTSLRCRKELTCTRGRRA